MTSTRTQFIQNNIQIIKLNTHAFRLSSYHHISVTRHRVSRISYSVQVITIWRISSILFTVHWLRPIRNNLRFMLFLDFYPCCGYLGIVCAKPFCSLIYLVPRQFLRVIFISNLGCSTVVYVKYTCLRNSLFKLFKSRFTLEITYLWGVNGVFTVSSGLRYKLYPWDMNWNEDRLMKELKNIGYLLNIKEASHKVHR